MIVLVAVLGAFISISESSIPSANANIFTKVLREAGEAGGKAARHGIDVPKGAATFLSKLPPKRGHLALTASATPAGHWTFTNAKGDIFTAATPDEMTNVARMLGPQGTTSNQKLALYMSEETLFERTEFLQLLPRSSTPHIVVGKQTFAIETTRAIGTIGRVARVRTNVVLPLTNRKAFDEALWQLARPLQKADIRVLSLRPGARASLPPVPRFGKSMNQALVDVIDPDALASSMSAVRGQTLLVSGRIEGALLHFTPNNGSPRSLNLTKLREAATQADVNLVILRSPTPRQPGGRNWLWQTVEVGGLKDAINRATFADFLNTLGASGSGAFRVTATPQGGGRVIIDATPISQKSTVPYSDVVGNWLSDITGHVTGNVLTTALTADMRDKKRQTELDTRIIPGIPSIYQFFYLGSLIAGLMAWTVSREVWAKIWPPEQRTDYRSFAAFNAARVVKMTAFLLIFLPIVGIPMLLLSVLLQIWTVLGWVWAILTSPLRLLAWLRKRDA